MKATKKMQGVNMLIQVYIFKSAQRTQARILIYVVYKEKQKERGVEMLKRFSVWIYLKIKGERG